ncbi:hypothetical protein D3C87_1666360 [compost metagenome]
MTQDRITDRALTNVWLTNDRDVCTLFKSHHLRTDLARDPLKDLRDTSALFKRSCHHIHTEFVEISFRHFFVSDFIDFI